MGTNRTCRVKRLRCSVRRTQKIAQDFPGTETAYTCASPWIFREGLAATGVEDALQHSDRPDFQAVVAPYGPSAKHENSDQARRKPPDLAGAYQARDSLGPPDIPWYSLAAYSKYRSHCAAVKRYMSHRNSLGVQ